MNIAPQRLVGYREQLHDYSDRVRRDASSVARQALTQMGGPADGGLSNAPLHMADVGTEAYLQELSATLLENEEFLVRETDAALRRIDEGRYGVCEDCGVTIAKARLDAIPYTRYCTNCAARATDGPAANLNAGRAGTFHDELSRAIDPPNEHAAGTPRGSADGGLTGTNVGRGDAENVALAATEGSRQLEMRSGRRKGAADSDLSGGAVGGTPAGQRGGPRKPAKRRTSRK